MGFSEDSLKHTQKKTLHAFKSLLQSSVTIRRDSLKLSSRNPTCSVVPTSFIKMPSQPFRILAAHYIHLHISQQHATVCFSL